MKSFLAACAFVVVALVLTGAIYGMLGESATDAYSTPWARVDHLAPRDGRLGWQPPEG